MSHQFKFHKGRGNIEVFRIPVSDPVGVVSDILNGDGRIVPDALNKIELVVGNIVISSETDEITWSNDVITIKPSVDHLSELSRQSHSDLVIYKGGIGSTISTGYVFIS